MKILKAIVDKMPSCCAMCNYFDDEVRACNVMLRGISVRTYQQSRPDWCPLSLTGCHPLPEPPEGEE